MPTYTPASLSEPWSATLTVLAGAAGVGDPAAGAACAASGATRAGGVAAAGAAAGAGAQARPISPTSRAPSRLGSQVRARGRLPGRGAWPADRPTGACRGARAGQAPPDDRAGRPELPRPRAV